MVPNQDHYAIVVGITDYAGFRGLSAAEGDAIAFANWLCDPNGGDIAPSQVRVIVSSGRPVPGKSYYPIKDDIDDALRTIISKQAGRIGKRFYFYFSGHGCTPSADEILLLMANTTADSMRRNIGPDPYRKWLTNGAVFDEILFILDCCLGSNTAPVSGEGPSLTPRPQDPNFVNVQALMALGTEFGQFSFAPDTADERSFFTKYLLEGLGGNAADADGAITAQTLREYVTPRVKAEALKYGRTQVPEIPVKYNIVFKPGKPDQQGQGGQRLLSFIIPPEWARPVELQDSSFKSIQRTDGNVRKFQAVLVPGLYQIKYPADAIPGVEQATIHFLRVNPTGTGGQVVLDPRLDPKKGQYDV